MIRREVWSHFGKRALRYVAEHGDLSAAFVVLKNFLDDVHRKRSSGYSGNGRKRTITGGSVEKRMEA